MDIVKNLVSVIVPIYNSEKYLKETLESAVHQTYLDIEIIVVDDGSTDASAQIVQELQQHHASIRYHLQATNAGAGVARNKGIELAKGQYIAFLDSDDLWLPEKISRQIELMKQTSSPFSYTAIEMMREDEDVKKAKHSIRESCDYGVLLKNTIIATSSVLVDRSVFGDFRMSTRRGGQDYATWLRLLRSGVVARGINEPLVRYRIRHDSLSSNKFSSIKQVWEIQTKEEGISKLRAGLNVLHFIFNAVKKHYL